MKHFFIISLLFVPSLVWSQESITVNGKTLRGREVNGSWIFEDSEDTLITVTFETYKALNKKIEQLQAQAQSLDEIIQAKDELIESFESYEDSANEHIDKQTELIAVADSLYVGYKRMYTDLKSIYGSSTFSVIAGGGINNSPGNDIIPFFNVGVEYRKIQLHLQLGNSMQGMSVNYRFPVF